MTQSEGQAPFHKIKAIITQIYPMGQISKYFKEIFTALRSRCPCLDRKKQVQRGIEVRLSHTASGTDSV